MSDYFTSTSANDKDMEIRSSHGNGMTSHCQYQRVAQWSQASKDSASQGHKASNFDNAKGEDTCVSEREYLQVGNKSAKMKLVSISVNHESNSEYKNICSSNRSKLELKVDGHQSVGAVGGEREKNKVDKSCDTESLSSDTQSLDELPGASYQYENNGACCSLHSEDANSDWNNFPIYGINQQVQDTLHSSKTIGYDQRSVAFSACLPARDTTFDTRIVKFTTEELAERIAQETKSVKFIKCMPACLHDGTGSMLHIFSDRFKLRNTRMGLPTRGKEKMEYVDSDYLFHDHSLKAGLANMSHQLCKYSDHTSWKLCELENGYNDLAGNEVMRSRMKRRPMKVQRDCMLGDLKPSCLGIDNDETPPTNFGSRRQPFYNLFEGLTKLNVPESFHQIIDKAPNQSVHNAETKMKDAPELSPREIITADSTYLHKSRGTAFFEMLTVPKSHVQHHGYSQTSCTDSGTKFETLATRFSKSPARTETMSIDSYRMPKSHPVPISTRLNKDYLIHTLSNSNVASHPPIKSYCYAPFEAKLPDGSEIKKDASVSVTESINLGQVLSHVKRSNASNSYSSWLKRLRSNTSNSLRIKRLKVDDASSTIKPHQLFAEIVKPKTLSSSKMDGHKEHIPGKTKQLKGTIDSSPGVSDKEIKTWIGRWCTKNPETIQSQVIKAGSMIHGIESEEPSPEHHQGRQFPSIAALALMGRVMNNLRTRQFRRRGSSVVWNTEGLL